MKTLKLTLHCGASAVDIEAVRGVKTPDALDSWMPIPHDALIERVTDALPDYGLQVVDTAHALTRDGQRYFGLMQVQRINNEVSDYGLVLGLRNSHDKSFAAGIVAGAGVFVCDNLSFKGEVKLARKHTTHIMRDMPALTRTGLGRIMQQWTQLDQRVGAYKEHKMDDLNARALLVSAVEVEALPRADMLDVLHEWRNPTHKDFEPRNAWSFFNAFTHVLKGRPLDSLSKRTTLLHGLFDTNLGLGAIEAKAL